MPTTEDTNRSWNIIEGKMSRFTTATCNGQRQNFISFQIALAAHLSTFQQLPVVRSRDSALQEAEMMDRPTPSSLMMAQPLKHS
ncbi:hypothetical protein PoB_004792100 [Plakobranchus ocellatus]|uniref:Uncharacterized protein n=1 Tax=Plakobranchus ocellatus TaxID=259542 RepID=A0AAV4BDI5_9GAST|nr:hypothetical protein PoB_004792100 [Plakobranchus ocellatus]